MNKKMEVKLEKENKLLSRKELSLHFSGDGAALTRDQIRSQIAKKYKADEKTIMIDSIDSHFGSQDFDVTAFIYAKEDIASKLTSEHLRKRNEIKAAAPAEETKEEA